MPLSLCIQQLLHVCTSDGVHSVPTCVRIYAVPSMLAFIVLV